MATIGAVSFLNSLPLYKTLENDGQDRIIKAVPSKLAVLLASGECDAALMPIVDHFRNPATQIISDACIGAHGKVRSVLIFTRIPPEEIKSVAVDTSSHTSVALSRIILADSYGVQPKFFEHAPDLEAMLQTYDAALLIGDPALEASGRTDARILDLAEEWLKLTGLPFVFAAWMGRRDDDKADLAALDKRLNEARDAGVRQIAQLAAEAATHKPLSSAQIEDYLTNAIKFRLTPDYLAGIKEFRLLCQKHSLI